MVDIRNKAEDGRNIVESIVRLVPGFRGYHQKEDRRETDKILREHLAAKLDRLRASLNPIIRGLTDAGDLDLTGRTDIVRKLLEKITYRLRYASYGYAGFFDAIKVDQEDLDRLYEFDAALLDRIQALEHGLAQLGAMTGEAERFKEMLRPIQDAVSEFDTHLDTRRSLIERDEKHVDSR